MKIFTIGFTKTSARHFFDRLSHSGATALVDVRLNNVSQLAGFAKRDDLDFFAERIAHLPYRHLTELAPDQQMLDDYKKRKGAWSDYARDFLDLMRRRKIEELPREAIDGACLLCSEDQPHHCHRRLVAEYLRDAWGEVEIVHL